MTTVGFDVIDGVGLIELRAPERRNALDVAMCDEIVATVEELEADAAVGAIVVTGAPPAFCAGADLSHLGSSQREGLLRIYKGFLRIARSPIPTIAAVNGAAVGAGMNLALACDVRLAARSARFDTRFLRLGIHPGGGHTWMIRQIAGTQVAAATVLFGEVLDGQEAERVGLAWRCVDDDELTDVAVRMAARAVPVPRELMKRAKATMATTASIETHNEAVELEIGPQLWSINQPAFAEQLAAMKARISSRRPTDAPLPLRDENQLGTGPLRRDEPVPLEGG
jgi:enoyl-CoA hydratase